MSPQRTSFGVMYMKTIYFTVLFYMLNKVTQFFQNIYIGRYMLTFPTTAKSLTQVGFTN